MFTVSRKVVVVLAALVRSGLRMRLLRWGVVCAVSGLSVTAAFGADTHAAGVICGVNACADLPSTVVIPLSQRNNSFNPARRPKPRPYYKVRIKSDGTDGYISELIVWVPSKHVFRMKEYVTPPLAAYWRTGNPGFEAQFAKVVQSGNVKPFPASRRYK
jgi:hypothetical protein